MGRTCARLVLVAPFALALVSGGCGGGNSGTPNPSTPDFSVTVTPATTSINAGASATFQVGVRGTAGFSSPVQIQIGGAPAGVSLTPAAAFSVTGAASQSVTVAVPAGAASATFTLTMTGTSGSLTHAATEGVTVNAAQGPPSRADFVRTDDSPMAAVYDRTHKRVYASNPVAGTVDVISSTTYQILRRITVPSPAGLDISPDDATVFVGTSTQAVYALDTASMSLTSRYVLPALASTPNVSQIQPPVAPVAAPDGTVLVSTTKEIVKWDPASGNTTTVLSNPVTQFEYGLVSPMAHSADHTRVILSNDFDASTVYVYDTQKNQFSAPLIVPGFAYAVAASPDGTQFAIAEALDAQGGASSIALYDANLKQTAIIPGGGSLVFSADGKYLYVASSDGFVPAVVVLDSKTLKVAGIAPSYATNIAYFVRIPPLVQETPLAVDETGRIFGRADHGLAIDDATDFRTYTGTEEFPVYDIISLPDDGPVNQQQPVQIETQAYPALPSIWFGPLPSTGTSISGSYMTTTAPALNQAGPVNIRVNGADHVQAWIPQGYTYGAMLSHQPDLAASYAGGGAINLFGYGISADDGTAADTAVTLGSTPATLTSARLYPAEQPYPFPLWHLNVKTPAKAMGASDLTVTTKWGTDTQTAGYHALDMRTYAVDATVYGMAYDPGRRRIYLAATDHIDVFSLSSGSFLATLQVPTVNKAKQLGGLALTPDGKWLVASNYADGSVAVINPDDPSTAKAVGIVAEPNVWGQGPAQVAAASNGKVFVGLGGPPFAIGLGTKKGPAQGASLQPQPANAVAAASMWLLDLGNLTAAPYAAVSSPVFAPFFSASPDGEQVCFTGLYTPLTLYQSSTDSVTYGPGQQGPRVCAVNGGTVGASQVSGGGVEMPSASDLSLRQLSISSVPDFQMAQLTGNTAVGLAVDSTGALLYQPFSGCIALWDSHTGEIREVVALPAGLVETSSGSMAANETGDQIYVVTSAGLTLIQMDALPLAIGSLTVNAGTWEIAGTGFVSGTSMTVDGKPVSLVLKDAHHLGVSNPPGWNAAHIVTLTNPDGHTYSYDAAYLR